MRKRANTKPDFQSFFLEYHGWLCSVAGMMSDSRANNGHSASSFSLALQMAAEGFIEMARRHGIEMP